MLSFLLCQISPLHSICLKKIPQRNKERERQKNSFFISFSTPMMTTVYQSYKKRKLFEFRTFCDPGCPVLLSGPFRDNVRSFIQQCGEIEDYNIQGMPIWCTLLISKANGVVFPLYTIEESVQHSHRPFCDHCRSIGWSHHLVSKRRYHLIIPMDDKWNKPLERGAFDVHNHIFHCLIHCNGFGHLLAINGLEGGSNHLRGREVMDLCDRICTALGARKITVEDNSKKRSMDLRLLYGVAYGYSWFGRWGFKFYHGSFGVNEHKYDAAIGILSSLLLDQIVTECNDGHIRMMVQVYRQMTDTQLTTIRDLMRFMFSVKAKAPVQRKSIVAASTTPSRMPPTKMIKQRKSPLKEKPKKFSTFATDMARRWPSRRLEYAAEVIVDALKEHRGGMSRQEVRDTARLHIGDTGLLDFVIKSINNYVVGNHLVKRTVNPVTKVLQFTIHEIGRSSEQYKSTTSERRLCIACPAEVTDAPGVDVYRDIAYLYEQVLEEGTKSELVKMATQVVIDSKHFAKEWPFSDEDDAQLRFICRVLPSPDELETELTRPFPPGEIVILPPYATIGELENAAENAFRDTYCVLENYRVRELEGLNGMDDHEVVFGTIESGTEVWVEGSGIDLRNELRYEGGVDSWIVNCRCGAKDDDGERMVACDICEVWHHTRCVGIGDLETVPQLFLCSKCSNSLMPEAALGEYGAMDTMDYY